MSPLFVPRALSPRAARLVQVSPENSADHPLASAAPESPVIPEAPGQPWFPNETPAVPNENGTSSDGVLACSNGALAEIATEPVDPAAALTETEPVVSEGEPALAENEPALTGIEPALTEGEPVRSTLSEWVITILLLLFLTTMLVQAFVIPTGSMEDTLLIGDHLLVDKMAYAPSGPISKYILPYREPKRGDIIVFRYPTDIQQTFVKRCMGIPGDRIHIVNKQVYVNGHRLDEPYKYNKTEYIEDYRDNFPSGAECHAGAGRHQDAPEQRAERRDRGAPQ